VSPDGKWIAMRTRTPDTGEDIVAVDLTQNGRVVPLVHTKFTERNPAISIDGRWIAYESDESGNMQVYVRPFPDVDSGRWQVSQSGGTRPLWARNGRELFFLTRDQRLMSAPFTTSPSFELGNPTQVADLSGYAVATVRNYDVSADGRRILVVAPADRGARPDINIVLNWVEELRKKIPVN
jgi:serine/threonine-protein kinase